MRLALILLAGWLIIAPYTQGVRAAETIDAILVVVNDEIITERDLRLAMEPVMAQYRASLSGSSLIEKQEEASRYILEKLVEERLLRSAAKREKIEVAESEIDEMADEIRQKFPSQESFDAVLREQGMSYKALRDRYRDQILRRRMVDINVRSRVSVSPGEVREYYDSHPEDFVGPKRARVRQILIRFGDERSEEEAKEIADSIIARMWEGKSMEAMARRLSESGDASDGGDMGWIEEGQMVSNIDRQIFKLSAGEHTESIRSQLGFHVFKVEEVSASEQSSFEQVRKRIHSFLFQKKTAEIFQVYISDLQASAYIAYHR